MRVNQQVQAGVGIMVIIACTCLFLVITFGSKNIDFFNQKQNTYFAQFDEIGGLYVKAPVRIAGVTIGFVKAITLNPKNYRAVVTVSINKDAPIPTDSIIKVYTEGVLGAKYLSIIPGYENAVLQNLASFSQTESSIILEGLLAQFINSYASGKSV